VPHAEAVEELDLSCTSPGENDPTLRAITDVINVLHQVTSLTTSFQGADLETLIELIPRQAVLTRLTLVKHRNKCQENTFATERNLIRYNPKLSKLTELRVQKMGTQQAQDSLEKVCATQGIRMTWHHA
jgi:hypothetical protein